MRLDDFIVLGRTVPEDSKKYGQRVCMAGYSPTLGSLARIYPLTIDNPLRARHKAVLDVQRNANDSRAESFQLTDASDGIYGVSSAPQWSTQEVCALATRQASPSLAALNSQRRSLGFLAITGTPTLCFKQRAHLSEPGQLSLFDEFASDLHMSRFLTGTDYPAIPYVQFHDGSAWHTLQLREWGCFEYLRKHEFRGAGLHKALGLTHQQDEWYALVGNMSHRRNVWLVIQLFHAARTLQRSLFDQEPPYGAHSR